MSTLTRGNAHFFFVFVQVPTVAMSGKYIFGRMAQSFYKTMGLQDVCCVATDLTRCAHFRCDARESESREGGFGGAKVLRRAFYDVIGLQQNGRNASLWPVIL